MRAQTRFSILINGVVVRRVDATVHPVLVAVQWARIPPTPWKELGVLGAGSLLIRAAIRDLFRFFEARGRVRGRWIGPLAYLSGKPRLAVELQTPVAGAWRVVGRYGLDPSDRVRIQFDGEVS